MASEKTVLVPIADGSEEIETVCIVDTLRRAKANVTLASVEKSTLVTCSRGIKIEADTLISHITSSKQIFDMVVLPGGMPGASRLAENKDLQTILTWHKDQNQHIAAICAAPAVVLVGKNFVEQNVKMTCHPNFVKDLHQHQQKQPEVSERVVRDGKIITSRGPGTALEFALVLVEELFGTQVASAVANPMLIKSFGSIKTDYN